MLAQQFVPDQVAKFKRLVVVVEHVKDVAKVQFHGQIQLLIRVLLNVHVERPPVHVGVLAPRQRLRRYNDDAQRFRLIAAASIRCERVQFVCVVAVDRDERHQEVMIAAAAVENQTRARRSFCVLWHQKHQSSRSNSSSI